MAWPLLTSAVCPGGTTTTVAPAAGRPSGVKIVVVTTDGGDGTACGSLARAKLRDSNPIKQNPAASKMIDL
jgi:hypothetical protein